MTDRFTKKIEMDRQCVLVLQQWLQDRERAFCDAGAREDLLRAGGDNSNAGADAVAALGLAAAATKANAALGRLSAGYQVPSTWL